MGPAIDLQARIAELRDALGSRRIRHGICVLEQIRPALEQIDVRPGSGILAGLVAQWVDAGFDGPDLVRRMLDRFPKELRPALPVADYLHLRMAEGFLAMMNEE